MTDLQKLVCVCVCVFGGAAGNRTFARRRRRWKDVIKYGMSCAAGYVLVRRVLIMGLQRDVERLEFVSF